MNLRERLRKEFEQESGLELPEYLDLCKALEYSSKLSEFLVKQLETKPSVTDCQMCKDLRATLQLLASSVPPDSITDEVKLGVMLMLDENLDKSVKREL